MANHVWRGISGRQGDLYYFDPAAWTVNGAATTKPPGPGGTVTVDRSSPGVPVFAVPGATTGDTVSGQTINFYGALGDRDFVSAMDANALDRAPDAGGLDYWTSRLGAGATRAAVVAGLSESAEHQRLTAASVLGNTPGQ